MNTWNFSAAAFLLVMIPCLRLCLKGPILERLIGLQLAQIVAVLVMVTLTEGYERTIYIDCALVLAILSPASALVFIRFVERWL